jgi:hypothetical protein
VAPLAEAFVRVRPDLTTFQRDTERGVSGAGLPKLGDSQGAAFGKALGQRAGTEAGNSLAAKFATFGAKLGPGLLAAFGVGAVKDAFNQIIGGASDLNESVSKSNVVFGKFAKTVQDAFRNAPKDIGQTTQAATEAAATLGNLFVSMKIGQPEAAKMSVSMVKLASDLASFNNTSPAEALEAIRAGLVGETEPLRRFGVNLNDAALKAEAMRLGLGPIGPTLTALQRTQAAYSLILQQTTTAQGDFTRTAAGAANQQRILAAQIQQDATNIGRVVLPAYQGLLHAVNDVGPGFIAAAAGVAVLSNRLAATGTGGKVFGDLRAAWQLYSEAVTGGAPRVATALQLSGGALTALRNAGSSLVGLFGGPWGLALTAATIGIGFFTQQMAKSKAETEAAVAAYVRFGNAAQQATSDLQVANLIKNDEALQKLIVDANRYGLSADVVTNALKGEEGATAAATGALSARREELVKQITAHTQYGARTGAVMDDTAHKAQAEVQEIDRLSASFGQTAEKQTLAAKAAGLYTEAAQAQKAGAVEQARVLEEQAAKTKALADAVGALGADYKPLEAVIASVTDKTVHGKDLADQYGAAIKAVADNAVPAGLALQTYGIITGQVATSQQSAAQRADEFHQIIQGISATAVPNSAQIGAISQVFGQVANAELSATDRANLLKQAWQAMFQPAVDATNASQQFNLALFGLKDQIDKSTTSLGMNSTGAINNRVAVENLIQRNNELYFANIASGMSAEQAGRLHADNGVKIEEAGRKAGLSTGQVRGLNDEYGRVPPTASTDVRATGVEGVLQQLRVLKIAQYALDNNISTAAAASAIAGQSSLFNQQVPYAARFAGGGAVYGPGGPTDDMVPATGPGGARYRLSNDEHIITAAEVKAAGGHAAIYALRAVLRGRRIRAKYPGDGSGGLAFAAGGQVWPFPVNASGTRMPYTMAELEAKFGGGPALAFVKGQVGKPYLWASAGPYGYDCSGIVSAVWNVIHGRYPYSHTFSTFNEAPYFPLSGVGGKLTAGWTNPGEPGPGGTSVGHTAGLIAGKYPFESTGSGGVRMGPGVTPVTAFAHVGHFDQGGAWPSGTLGVNTSGRTEHVMTGATMDQVVAELRRIVAAVERVAPGVGAEINGAGRRAVQMARAY